MDLADNQPSSGFTAAATIVVLTRTRLLRVQTVERKTVKVCCYLLHPFQTHFMAVTASLAPNSRLEDVTVGLGCVTSR